MPLLPLPSWPDLPTAGTPLTRAQVEALYDRLLQFTTAALFAQFGLSDAWEAHHTQYGRPAPQLRSAMIRQWSQRTPPDATNA
jgi:hypothetical protein